MADVFRDAVRAELTARSHGFATKTPSARGEPPAMISGALAGSVFNEPARPLGDATYMSESGPTTRYSRIQELGGWMRGHPFMHWWEDGSQFWSAGHELPKRPYMLPAHELLVSSGALTDAAAAAFAEVVGV